MALNLIKKREPRRDPEVQGLIDLLLPKVPPRFHKYLPRVVDKSWANYSKFWANVPAHPNVPYVTYDSTERLLHKLLVSDFFTNPYYFVKRWVLTTMMKELAWKKSIGDAKWAVWTPRNKLFLEEGREEANTYCGQPERFDALLKELLK